MRPSRRLAALVALIAGAGGCGAAPVPRRVEPKPVSMPALPPPPWQTRLSVAQGYEPASPTAPPVLIRGATLMLATGKTIARGSILLERGKIAAIAEGDLPARDGAVVIDGTGKFVTPGIIDTHSHLGVYPMPGAAAHEDGNEMSDPLSPHAQAVDAFWPQDPGISRALAGGVTTLQVLPGSGNLIGGRAVTIKLRDAVSPREMHVAGAPDGLKMACGENPKRAYGKDKRAPMTRMGNVALQRAAFLRAAKLQRDWFKWRDAESRRLLTGARKRNAYEAARDERARLEAGCVSEGRSGSERCATLHKAWIDAPLEEPEVADPIPPPDRDPGLETLVGALEGKVLVHVHCYRADDMMAMVALATEVGFQIRSFHHALEAYKIRNELASRGIATSTWADWWGFKMEAYDGIPENAALVHEAGGRAIIHSDSPEGIQRLNQEAAKAMASGRAAGVALTAEDAIRWITIHPAWALGIDWRTGSLELGKDADVVLWNRDPFSVYAVAERVWVDGVLRSDRSVAVPARGDFELGQDPQALPPAVPVRPDSRGAPVAPAPLVPGSAP
jgi:imidazolonepropionase-like amidohydrolase